MNRKVIVNIAFFFLVSINILLYFNVNKYINVLSVCFDKNLSLNQILYVSICFIIAFISILIFISIKLVVQNEKDEIKGIKFKIEDGTFGTANWMSDEEIKNVLGVIDYEEYRV